MKILLVANYARDQQASMALFAEMLFRGLRECGHDVELIRPSVVFGRLARGNGGVGKWLGYVDKFLLFPRVLRRAASRAEIVHICDHSNAMYLECIRGRPHLIMCHDLLAVRSALGEFPTQRTRFTGRILQRWILSSLKKAPMIVCISEATRKDVLRLAGRTDADTRTIWLGLNYNYEPDPEVFAAAEARRRGEPFDATVFERAGIPSAPYLLHVGGDHWYKNRACVLAIHAEVRRRMGAAAPLLVMAGAPTKGEGVVCYPSASCEQLAALYSGAEALLFPSLEEGAGWPPLEAQACGCRVITTGKPPMTEVSGDAGFYLDDPPRAEQGADLVCRLLAQSAAERSAAVEKGKANASRFSAAEMIEQYLAIYDLLVHQKRPLNDTASAHPSLP